MPIPLLMLIYARPRNHQRFTPRLIASRVHAQRARSLDIIMRRITREPPTIPIKTETTEQGSSGRRDLFSSALEQSFEPANVHSASAGASNSARKFKFSGNSGAPSRERRLRYLVSGRTPGVGFFGEENRPWSRVMGFYERALPRERKMPSSRMRRESRAYSLEYAPQGASLETFWEMFGR